MPQTFVQKRIQMAYALVDAATQLNASLDLLASVADLDGQVKDAGATQIFQDSDFDGQTGLEHLNAYLCNVTVGDALAALVTARDSHLNGDPNAATLGDILRAVRRVR